MRDGSDTEGVDLPAGLALFAVAVTIAVFALRRAGRGERRWLWVLFAPVAATQLYLVWTALQTWTEEPALATVLCIVGVTSFVLFLRSARSRVADGLPSDPDWTLSSAGFDYIVWTALGVPMLLAGFLLLWLVTGGFGSAQ